MNYELIVELNKFNNIVYDDIPHTYTLNNDLLTSVTTMLGRYEEKRDWVEIARKYAIKHSKDPKEVLQEWDEAKEKGGDKGTIFHLYAENAVSNKLLQYDSTVMPIELEVMWKEFWTRAKPTLIPVRSEFVVGDAELKLGGMVDQLFWNTKMKELQIWDWKTNKKITTENRWNKFTGPLKHLEETSLNMYSLQLLSYKRIIERNTNLKLGQCFIAHFNENYPMFTIHKTRDLEKEIDLIFDELDTFA